MPSPFVLLGLRPRLRELSAVSGHHHGRAVAEGDQFAHPPSGVPAHEEAVLGEAVLGQEGQTVTSGSQTNEMVARFVEEQEGDLVHGYSLFPLDTRSSHRFADGGCSLHR